MRHPGFRVCNRRVFADDQLGFRKVAKPQEVKPSAVDPHQKDKMRLNLLVVPGFIFLFMGVFVFALGITTGFYFGFVGSSSLFGATPFTALRLILGLS